MWLLWEKLYHHLFIEVSQKSSDIFMICGLTTNNKLQPSGRISISFRAVVEIHTVV